MISIEEALAKIRGEKVSLKSKTLSLQDALNHYLAREIKAPFDLPSYDNSAMDGYAICGNGNAFEIIGEVAAGDVSSHSLSEGQAMRIFTGGKIPENVTAVIMQEHTDAQENKLTLLEEVIEGKNIRKKGTELARGRMVFSTGQKINPATVGLISSLGISEINVFSKPTIRIIATGNELIQPGQEKEEGQIYESNTHTLIGVLKDYNFSCNHCQIIPDDLESIQNGIAADLERCDVLLLSGGISVGEYDFVKQALEANGVREQFYKVRQKPGKPLYFGRKDNRFVFALPGNPASSLTCFYIYVLPLLEKLSGGKGKGLQQVKIPLKEEYHFKFDRPTFLKAYIEEREVVIMDGQSSSMLHSMAMGNALVFLDRARLVRKGEEVNCIMI
ncbi:MAG: gephyrin-like molybdotransferase Glp [Bacteroidota bacterium]